MALGLAAAGARVRTVESFAPAVAQAKQAAEAQQLACRPHTLRVHVRHVRVERVKQQPQLVRQRRRPLLLVPPAVLFLFLVGVAYRLGRHQPAPDQLSGRRCFA